MIKTIFFCILVWCSIFLDHSDLRIVMYRPRERELTVLNYKIVRVVESDISIKFWMN